MANISLTDRQIATLALAVANNGKLWGANPLNRQALEELTQKGLVYCANESRLDYQLTDSGWAFWSANRPGMRPIGVFVDETGATR